MAHGTFGGHLRRVLCIRRLHDVGLAFATPLLRQRRNVWLNDEDAKRFSGTVADVEHRDVARLIVLAKHLKMRVATLGLVQALAAGVHGLHDRWRIVYDLINSSSSKKSSWVAQAISCSLLASISAGRLVTVMMRLRTCPPDRAK